MNTSNHSPSMPSFVLSREELLFLLRLIGAKDIPGLGDDPLLGQLNTEQQALGMVYAERTLRDRGLARIDESSELQLHTELLQAVTACAFSHRSIVVYHLDANRRATQYFGHIREQTVIAHTKPEPPLHRLHMLHDEHALIQEILTLVQAEDMPESDPAAIVFPLAFVPKIRELAAQGEHNTALNLLLENGVAAGPGSRLLQTLAGKYALTIFQNYNRLLDGSFLTRSVTLLRNQHIAWMMFSPQKEDGNVTFRPFTTPQLRELLESWLKVQMARIPE